MQDITQSKEKTAILFSHWEAIFARDKHEGFVQKQNELSLWRNLVTHQELEWIQIQ